jgi:hypothetical protein
MAENTMSDDMYVARSAMHAVLDFQARVAGRRIEEFAPLVGAHEGQQPGTVGIIARLFDMRTNRPIALFVSINRELLAEGRRAELFAAILPDPLWTRGTMRARCRFCPMLVEVPVSDDPVVTCEDCRGLGRDG